MTTALETAATAVGQKLAIFSIMFTPTPPALIQKSQVMAGIVEVARLFA